MTIVLESQSWRSVMSSWASWLSEPHSDTNPLSWGCFSADHKQTNKQTSHITSRSMMLTHGICDSAFYRSWCEQIEQLTVQIFVRFFVTQTKHCDSLDMSTIVMNLSFNSVVKIAINMLVWLTKKMQRCFRRHRCDTPYFLCKQYVAEETK